MSVLAVIGSIIFYLSLIYFLLIKEEIIWLYIYNPLPSSSLINSHVEMLSGAPWSSIWVDHKIGDPLKVTDPSFDTHLNGLNHWINYALILNGTDLLAIDEVVRIIIGAFITVHM